TGIVDAGGAAGENQAARLQLGDALGRKIVADQLAEDVQLAHPASDELGVLRAEIQDQDALALGRGNGIDSLSCHSGNSSLPWRAGRVNAPVLITGGITVPARLCYCPNSVARRVAASIASISAARSPPRSSACNPAIVVPPGLATMSFSTPGCWPV